MESIKQTFFQECEEQLSELESGLLAMEEGREEPDTVNAVFRAVHSIKGGAGAFKLNDLVQFSHAFETVLDRVRCDRLPASSLVLKVMLRAADILSDLVAAARENRELTSNAWKDVVDELRGLSEEAIALPASVADLAGSNSGSTSNLGGFTPTPMVFEEFPPLPNPATIAQIRFKPNFELYAKANDVVPILREVGRLGKVETACDVGSIPYLEEFDPAGAYLSWTITLETQESEATIREAFEFVEGDCTLEISVMAAVESSHNNLVLSSGEVELTRQEDVEIAGGDSVGKSEPPPSATKPANVAAAVTTSAVLSSVKAERAEAAAAMTLSQPTIRVDFERVDRLINLVGELVINQAMLSQRVIEAGVASSPSVAMGLDELEQLTREIQESVMAIRAQPVRPLFQRMSRIAREVADATGKMVRLKTEGDATEIDKTVVERLADPLTHMIRNAIDHGVESPEARVAAGKPAEGVVRLVAGHKSGRVIIEVGDDGAGIDRPRVRSIAINKGLIPLDAQLTDVEIDNLLFLPGFSTASSVSSISGRGVGMDVVKRSIQALGGRISISSRPGLGSTFTMSLPLTLAVLDGMVVAVNNQTFVVPLTAIVETIKPAAGSVHILGVSSRVIGIRDNFLPLIDVGSELGIREMMTAAHNGVAILVETEGGARTALLVDSIQDQRQVVIKSLEANYGPTPGVAAATILGDGRVALILDVEALVASRSEVTSSCELSNAVGA